MVSTHGILREVQLKKIKAETYFPAVDANRRFFMDN